MLNQELKYMEETQKENQIVQMEGEENKKKITRVIPTILIIIGACLFAFFILIFSMIFFAVYSF